jgi:hypothetical protein
MKKARTYDDLERRIKGALLSIDIAITHLKSITFANNDPSIESAIAWLVDAKNELQPLLDDISKNIIVSVEKETATRVAKRARVAVEDAVEALITMCINEHIEHG